jgi:legumain
MLFNLLILLVTLFALVSSDNWGVIIAGSNYYFNYRHQSDACHAYHILTESGKIPPQNVILMIYDDIANSSENPFKGQLFNKPNGTNVYAGIEIAYRGDSVNKTTFLKVLRGDKSAGGKVLKSTENDDVFIYYTDHGATGLVGMPVGDPLYANELMDALNYMHDSKMYRQLVFYLEACESGSMFDGILPKNMSIFATTAATPDQSSYAYYYWDPVQTYLGDEYSIRWMEDSDKNSNKQETLKTQFAHVSQQVKLSQPQQYGTTAFENEPIWDFEGNEASESSTTSTTTTTQVSIFSDGLNDDKNNKAFDSSLAVDSRDVKLAYYMTKYEASLSLNEKRKWSKVLNEEIQFRANVTSQFKKLMQIVTQIKLDSAIDALMLTYRPPRNFECLKQSVSLYERRCGKFTEYSLKFVKNIVFLCEEFNPKYVTAGILQIC